MHSLRYLAKQLLAIPNSYIVQLCQSADLSQRCKRIQLPWLHYTLMHTCKGALLVGAAGSPNHHAVVIWLIHYYMHVANYLF